MDEQQQATTTFLGPQEFGSRLDPPLSAAQIRKLCDSDEIKAFRSPSGNRIIPATELERFRAERSRRR